MKRQLLVGALLGCMALAVGCVQRSGMDTRLDLERIPPAFEVLQVRGMPEDATIVRLLAPYKEEVDKWRAPIGRSAAPLPIVRRENPLGSWIADAARSQSAKVVGKPIDMVLLNSGGIRSNLPGGEISYYDISQILPFDNTIVYMELEGDTLRAVVAAVASQMGRTALSGFTIEADAEGNLISFKIGGQEPEPNRTYRFATVDFLAMGAGGFPIFKDIPHTDTRVFLRDVVADYVRALNAAGRMIEAPTDYSRQTFGGLRVEDMP